MYTLFTGFAAFDLAHLVRFGVNLALASIFSLILVVVLLLLLARHNVYPLKAYSLPYQISKIIGTSLLVIFTACAMTLPALAISAWTVFLSHFFVIPALHRFVKNIIVKTTPIGAG